MESDEVKLLTDHATLTEERSYDAVIAEMLKDTGIRTMIIKQYLPVMNKLINHYLQTLDFFVSFTLDENFNEIIKSRHRDEFTYASFSEGERTRIDLALLFTWRQIAKMKNSSSTNLLILDEVADGSLSATGFDNMMKIIELFKDDANIFVISHRADGLDGKFNRKLEFSKDKNFTAMTVSN
jgi:DNA repair exonuclease SbcCD ATPase subunit